ncbi:hypothetical protein KXR53_00520 [Inquilinus limosus]|uniref:hypothetical protein n=1 Tax=Inquilinus limosus TaxID=171674 RepID=UPI003F174BE0
MDAGEAVAIGLKAHSGWAALVAVAGPPAMPRVVDRRQLMTADPADAQARFPYHAAEGLDDATAEALVHSYAEAARERADASLGDTLADLRGRGLRPVGCALLPGPPKPLPGLTTILASHALIHTAEGVLFRDVLVDAAGRHGLLISRVSEDGLAGRCATVLGWTGDRLNAWLAETGRALGPPWRQDERLGTLAALLCLLGAV